MSTRSNIAIRVPEEWKNKKTLLNGDLITANYLQVYIHFDGYYDGVGACLANNFNDKTVDYIYDMLIKNGASSYINSNGTIEGSYYHTRHEDLMIQQLDKPKLDEEYLYVFEDGIWTVRAEHDVYNGPLNDYFAKDKQLTADKEDVDEEIATAALSAFDNDTNIQNTAGDLIDSLRQSYLLGFNAGREYMIKQGETSDPRHINVPNINFSHEIVDNILDNSHNKWVKQRKLRGYDDTELWDFGVTLAKFALPRLKDFISTKISYDPRFNNFEDYKNHVNDMIWCLEHIINDDYDNFSEEEKEKYTNVFNTLNELFTMWR